MSGEDITGIVAVFMVFILPLWLILHYITRWKAAKRGLAEADLQRLNDLESAALNLQERVEVLESILDEKAPEWRREA